MDIKTQLFDRANSKCELCSSTDGLNLFEVPPVEMSSLERSVLLCGKCQEQVEDHSKIDVNHWHCLNDSMWSEHAAVQVLAWRMLTALEKESWASDLVEQLYMEGDVLAWAKQVVNEVTIDEIVVKDSNGAILQGGDSVTIIKDLDVKGAGFTAKRGTLVKKISLGDDPDLIEGRVNGTKIYLKTCFLKKV